MTAWLSFWNAATRLRTEVDLSSAPVSEIYVPWGKQKLKRGDAIYCVYVTGGELRLITRIREVSLDDDSSHHESVYVKAARSGCVYADYGRVVKRPALRAIEYLRTDNTAHRMDKPNPRRFQGRASIRELKKGPVFGIRKRWT